MDLKDYIQMIIKLKKEAKNGDFLLSLIDAFIRNPFSNEIIENPLLKYESTETLRGICNGNKLLSKKCASEIYSLYQKDKLMSFFYHRTDNFDDLKYKILKYGFEIDEDNDVPSTLADLLAKIIENTSKGIRQTYPPLREFNPHNINVDAFKNIFIKNDILYINNQAIELPNYLTPEKIKIDYSLPYVIELFQIYSHLSNTPIQTIDDLKKFPEIESHFNEQSRCYYLAEAMKNYLKTLFTDGEEHFNILKEEIFDSIFETSKDLSLTNSYQKLKNVLEMVTKATLNSSILLNIKGLVTIKEKKGICHILVNEGRITWQQTHIK